MRFSRTKAIVLSAVLALLSVGAVVAASFALFSDDSQSTVHLSAGTLEARLYRTNLSGTRMNGEGLLVAFEDDSEVDLTEAGDQTVFDLKNIVPGARQEAALRVENRGGIAFDYTVSVLFTLPETDAEAALAKQLTVTVTPGSGTPVSFALADAAEKGQNIALGRLNAMSGQTPAQGAFTVEVSFAAGEGIDNSAMGAELHFDLLVRAVQAV